MKIHDLIDTFSGYVTVPIDPDEVAAKIKQAGISDRISFVEVQLDIRVLRGALHSYVLRDGVYGEPILHSDIYHARGLTRAWRRLVCCKELLHVLDNSLSKTARPDDVESLLDRLCIAIEDDTDPLTTLSMQVWRDRLQVYYAIAILFPLAVRDLLKPPYDAGKINLEEISSHIDLPLSVVRLVMDDSWVTLYKSIIGSN